MIIYDNSKNTIFRYDEYIGKYFVIFLKTYKYILRSVVYKRKCSLKANGAN